MRRRIPLEGIGTAEFRIDHDQAAKHVNSRSKIWKRGMVASKSEEIESEGEACRIVQSI